MLTTTVERLEGNNVKLSVTISGDEVDAAIEAAYKKVQTQVKIPGFRPGKAPRPMIDTVVGREYVLQQATEELVDSSYPRALDLEALRPIEQPEMEMLDLVEAGTDYSYVAEITVRPEYELTDITGFAVTAPPTEAPQHEIDMQVDVLRDRYASLEPVEDRGIEKGDFALISFVGTVGGEVYDGNTVDQYLYETGAGLMPSQFDDGLMGATAGQELKIEFEIPETSTVEEYVGKTAAFDVVVHEIKAKKLPEIDDEFALNVGGFESVDDMFAEMRKHLDTQAYSEHQQARERNLRQLLASRLQGEIPTPMVDSRAETMKRDFFVMLDSRGMTPEQYLAGSGMDMDALDAEIRTSAEQGVKEDLALESLFRALNLEVTDEDIDQEVAEFSTASKTTPEEARAQWEKLGIMSVVREGIMHRKAVEWLLENSEVTVVTPEEAASASESADKDAAPKKDTKKKAPAKKAAAKKDNAETDTGDDVEATDAAAE